MTGLSQKLKGRTVVRGPMWNVGWSGHKEAADGNAGVITSVEAVFPGWVAVQWHGHSAHHSYPMTPGYMGVEIYRKSPDKQVSFFPEVESRPAKSLTEKRLAYALGVLRRYKKAGSGITHEEICAALRAAERIKP